MRPAAQSELAALRSFHGTNNNIWVQQPSWRRRWKSGVSFSKPGASRSEPRSHCRLTHARQLAYTDVRTGTHSTNTKQTRTIDNQQTRQTTSQQQTYRKMTIQPDVLPCSSSGSKNIDITTASCTAESSIYTYSNQPTVYILPYDRHTIQTYDRYQHTTRAPYSTIFLPPILNKGYLAFCDCCCVSITFTSKPCPDHLPFSTYYIFLHPFFSLLLSLIPLLSPPHPLPPPSSHDQIPPSP